jgi:hypothetical protein
VSWTLESGIFLINRSENVLKNKSGLAILPGRLYRGNS